MKQNLYHLLGFIPATESWEMPPALEALARQLVHSGKLRINADAERNFVRLGTRQSDQTFTARELTDPTLLPKTRRVLTRHVAPAEGPEGLDTLLARLYDDLKKARGVSLEKELKVARVLVQSAHPAVIQLILAGGTELFVSYSHNVGDLLPVHEWSQHGQTSGLQATDTQGTAVYVSAGGDPFFEGEHKHYTTDGFPALARMVVIAGQELGHFADLRRTQHGILGRHSTDPNHSQLRAAPAARDGRLADMRQTAQLQARYYRCGLASLRRAEQGVAFYHTRMRYSPPWLWYQLRRLVTWALFAARCRKAGIHQSFRVYPFLRHGDAIEQYCADMAFNLAPDADVYRHPDPLVEEAIAVIEAVARVPQQVHKWGHAGVANAWPHLYAFYYKGVIPAALPWVNAPPTPLTFPKIQWLIAKLRRLVRKKPGYYP